MTDAMQNRLAPLTSKPAGSLLLHEIYRSVQGESMYQGLPCVFIRTTTCDLRCTWCDTPHAFTQGTPWTLDAILEKVAQFKTPVVEITGGEPLVQPEVFELMTRLCDLDYSVLLETGGHRDISGVDRRVHIIMDLKCPASGEEAANRWGNVDLLKPGDEVKFVIASAEDFRWAAGVCERLHLTDRVNVLVSPVFGRVTPLELTQWLLDSGLNARMQIQLHKQIWEPNARGV
jgi:7-carboxy-7-deazaguanine synthase